MSCIEIHQMMRCVSPTSEEDHDSYLSSSWMDDDWTQGPSSEVPADVTIEQDETSIILTLQMEGVKGRDISVSVQEGVLMIEGYRTASGGGRDHQRRKKQRLQRRFPIDTSLVDISRAMANIWQDKLVLYAPKRRVLPRTLAAEVSDVEEVADYEFSTPEADRIGSSSSSSPATISA